MNTFLIIYFGIVFIICLILVIVFSNQSSEKDEIINELINYMSLEDYNNFVEFAHDHSYKTWSFKPLLKKRQFKHSYLKPGDFGSGKNIGFLSKH